MFEHRKLLWRNSCSQHSAPRQSQRPEEAGKIFILEGALVAIRTSTLEGDRVGVEEWLENSPVMVEKMTAQVTEGPAHLDLSPLRAFAEDQRWKRSLDQNVEKTSLPPGSSEKGWNPSERPQSREVLGFFDNTDFQQVGRHILRLGVQLRGID